MIENDYYDWLCSTVRDADFDPSRYQLLMSMLYHTEFTWVLPNDEPRALDGIALRNTFAEQANLDPVYVKMQLKFPCTVLEMMIALSVRCESQIMEDLFVGNRTGRWFKSMIDSLGLTWENDELYDESYVEYIIASFLNREYERNGDGGLFKVSNPNVLGDSDLRREDIWYQMNMYLRSLEAE